MASLARPLAALCWCALLLAGAHTDDAHLPEAPRRDIKWPHGQLNVLTDAKSLNQSERALLAELFRSLEARTCVRVRQLPPESTNPFDPECAPLASLGSERNFVHIFKSAQLGAHSRHPSTGLSSLGCLRQGRQSLVLTALAFRWPELVLRYHVMRTLGVDQPERPDGQVRRLLNTLPLSHKIGGGDDDSAPADNFLAYSSSGRRVAYLHEDDFARVRRLYGCAAEDASLHSRAQEGEPTSAAPDGKLLAAEDALEGVIAAAESSGGERLDGRLIDEAARHIVDYLLADAECGPDADSCPARRQQRSTTNLPPEEPSGRERPMLLKLDQYHAQDPQLRQANQIQLSQPSASERPAADYANSWPQQPKQQAASQPSPKSEMLISFEQNPIAAPGGLQVLKLCSCSCQTVTPTNQQPATPSPQVLPDSQPQPMQPFGELQPNSELPPDGHSNYNATERDDDWTRPYAPSEAPPPTTSEPAVAPVSPPEEPATTSPVPAATSTEPTSASPAPATTSPPPATTSPAPAATSPEPATTNPAPATTSQPPATTSPPVESSKSESARSLRYCDAVEWVAPNRTVYASARIVWDVDRENQNYFLCNNALNGELVPGKTHGFSCKLGSEGRAYELHNFSVLTKPERTNLAWVAADSLGASSLPVLGGHSRSGGPLSVARCLVRDEATSGELETLIGYVDGAGEAWFPLADVQIECAHFDVLACIN